MKLIVLATAAMLAATAAEARDPGYGGRNSTQNYNYTGIQRGSGPYDSAIAQMGIGAGASVLNNVISNVMRQAQQPVIMQQPVINGYRTMPGATTGTIASPNCFWRQYGTRLDEQPLVERVCR